MAPRKISRKAIWAVAGAVVLVAALLTAFFLAQKTGASPEGIVLPSQDAQPAGQEASSDKTGTEAESDYYEVTVGNVCTALQSLNRPTAYHQTYTVTVGADEVQAVRQVELWTNGQYLHAEVSGDQQIRSLISDGETAYLWYDSEENWIQVKLESGTTAADLLGLPEFDAYLTMEQDSIVDAGYLVLEDPAVQCIYVCTQNEISDTSRFWVDLQTGLLYQADVLEESRQVYSIRQTQFEMLAVEDESFRDRFLLPDGTAPFIAARAVQQP